MLRNIFFVGLMGAGKTTVGKHLAKSLEMDFYDTDQEIEKRTGVRIPTIFEMEGEAGFRKREVLMIDELTQMSNIVLATGGGAVLNAENRQHLASRGTVIYLRASVQDLYLRTRFDRNRPLLQNTNAQAKLEQLFSERDPLYREVAHHIVDTGNQPVANIVQKIEELIGVNN
ncbi:MAG: shikimate kinase AroK [Methylophilaceae bacterium]|nr:shikimate kinase AroK [Methylophilaceae bacterium]